MPVTATRAERLYQILFGRLHGGNVIDHGGHLEVRVHCPEDQWEGANPVVFDSFDSLPVVWSWLSGTEAKG